MRIWMRFCSVKIEGIDHIKNIQGAVVFASNHLSEFDPLFISASLPFWSDKLPVIYVALARHAYKHIWDDWRRWLYGGVLFRMIGGYAAERGLRDYGRALRRHVEALESGLSVCIFPVGRRHARGDISKARGGVIYLAKTAKLPIIPIHLTHQNLQAGTRPGWRGQRHLKIVFGAPVPVGSLFDVPIDAVLDQDVVRFEAVSHQLMKHIESL